LKLELTQRIATAILVSVVISIIILCFHARPFAGFTQFTRNYAQFIAHALILAVTALQFCVAIKQYLKNTK